MGSLVVCEEPVTGGKVKSSFGRLMLIARKIRVLLPLLQPAYLRILAKIERAGVFNERSLRN